MGGRSRSGDDHGKTLNSITWVDGSKRLKRSEAVPRRHTRFAYTSAH
jgi:hypothetical protein